MRKAAKVYEASEAVEGMKPKMTFESHKKCTPGEFGMQVKSAMKLRLGTPMEYAAFTGGGAGLGALVGALTARRGKLLRDAMRGGLVGAGAGAGFNLGGNLANGLTYDHVLNHGPLVSGGAGLGALVGAAAVDNALGDEKKEKNAFEKAAIPAFGGRNFSLAPRGFGLGLNAGYDYLGGVVPNPYVGVDIGTPHTGIGISGPIPGISLRSGMFTRPPGATSSHNRHGLLGHRSLWKYLADSYSGRDPAEVEDEVHDDRLQSMRNVTKDEFHEAIPDYHEGPKGKPLSKDLHKALTEYYHRNSRPEKKSADLEKEAKGGALGRFLETAGNTINSYATPAIGAVGNAARNLAQSPQAVGTQAMLAARRNLKPSMWHTGNNAAAVQEALQSKSLVNPNYNRQYSRVFDELRNAGVGQNQAATNAEGVVQRFIPRRDALLSVGSQAANRHMARQLGVYGAGAVGATALDSAVRARMNQPQPMVSPAMHNLFQNMPAAQAQPAADATGMIKTQSAVEFGQKVAFNIDWNALKHPAIAGAGLGALAGGVHGLINPGTDEKGNTRSRFGAMLRGALGGGAIGGLGGAAAGHFAPKATNDFLNNMRYQYTMHTPVPTAAQAADREYFENVGDEPAVSTSGIVNPPMQAAQG